MNKRLLVGEVPSLLKSRIGKSANIIPQAFNVMCSRHPDTHLIDCRCLEDGTAQLALLEDARIQSLVTYINTSIGSKVVELCIMNMDLSIRGLDRITLNPTIVTDNLSSSACQSEDSMRWVGSFMRSKDRPIYSQNDILSLELSHQDMRIAITHLILTKQLFGRLTIEPHPLFPMVRVIRMQFKIHLQAPDVPTSVNQDKYDSILFRFLNGSNLEEYEENAVIPISEFVNFIPEQTDEMHALYVCSLTKLVYQIHQFSACVIALSDIASESVLTNYITGDVKDFRPTMNNAAFDVTQVASTIGEATPLYFKNNKNDTEMTPVPGGILLPRDVTSVQRPTTTFPLPTISGYIDSIYRDIVAMITLTKPERTFTMVHHHEEEETSLAHGSRQQTLIDLFADSVVARLNEVNAWKSRQIVRMFNRYLRKCPASVVQWANTNIQVVQLRYFTGQVPRDIHLMIHGGSNSIEEYMASINATAILTKIETERAQQEVDREQVERAHTDAEFTRKSQEEKMKNDMLMHSTQLAADIEMNNAQLMATSEMHTAKLENDRIMLLEKLQCEATLKKGTGDNNAVSSVDIDAYSEKIDALIAELEAQKKKTLKRKRTT